MLDFLLLVDILPNIHPDFITSQQNVLCFPFTEEAAHPLYLMKHGAEGQQSAGSQHLFQSITLLPLVFLPLGGFSSPLLTLTPPTSLLASRLSPSPSELSSDVISRKVLSSQLGLGAHCHCSSGILGHLCHSLCLAVLQLLLTTGSLRRQSVFYI